jgi:hypothetical protein
MTIVSDSSEYNFTSNINGSGDFNTWETLPVYIGAVGGQTEVRLKVSGKLKGNLVVGDIFGQWEIPRNFALCAGNFKLAREGTAEAIALMTGRKVEVVRLEQQLLEQQNSVDNTYKLAQREENERLTERSARVKANFAKLRIEEKRLIRRRADEEKQIAAMRVEQKKIAVQQKREADRLTKLKADAESKVQQLTVMREKNAPKTELGLMANIKFGKYHALVIGINDYKNLTNLGTAVADADAISEILSKEYGFKVTKLINPTRDNILDALDNLQASLKFEDNLLIYYAGHGWLDEKSDQGYWLATDAKKNRRSRWVSNSTLTDTLKSIAAKHVMVVADSCYSGRLVRGLKIRTNDRDDPEYYQKISRKKARVVVTSGGLEPVEDGKGKHSPFARAFLNILKENDGVLDGSKMFQAIRRPVMVNANQTPQYSDVRRAGHDGGDFLFVRRN